MQTIEEVLTLKEAAEIWDLNPANLRQAIYNNKFPSSQVRKSGGTWLILKDAMLKIYGEIVQTTSIYTIGYEGKNIGGFIKLLCENNIHTIFDVRKIPLSRKQGFSKSALEKSLEEHDIGYYNFKELGSPKELREKLYRDKDYESFFSGYKSHLLKQYSALDMLISAVMQNIDKNSCLLCFENDPNTCHRIVIAQELLTAEHQISRIINL